MKERRIQRLQEVIKERVAEVIDQELADPRRGLVTITKVKLDRELTQCVVYWSILGDAAQRRTNERMLARAAGFVQRELGPVLHTRTIPRLRFEYDESIAGAQRIDSLLTELRHEREEREGRPADDGADAEVALDSDDDLDDDAGADDDEDGDAELDSDVDADTADDGPGDLPGR